MTKSRALVSSVTSMVDKQFRADHLKLCFLWYDEVLFETIGSYDEKRFFESLLKDEQDSSRTIHSLSDVILPVESRVGKDVIGDVLTRMGPGYPRWGENYENYTYPEPETGEQYAHNVLLESIAKEHGLTRFEDGYDIEQAEGRARVAVDAVLLWERVHAELPCMLQTNGDEKLAMTAAYRFSAGAGGAETPFSLFEVAVPSLADVSWKKVVELRKDGSLGSLRSKISESIEKAGGDLELAKSIFDGSESEAINAIIDKGRPRVIRLAIESILANIPGLPVNPFSVFFGLRDTAGAYKKYKDLGWFYLLRDIKQSAASNTTESRSV